MKNSLLWKWQGHISDHSLHYWIILGSQRGPFFSEDKIYLMLCAFFNCKSKKTVIIITTKGAAQQFFKTVNELGLCITCLILFSELDKIYLTAKHKSFVFLILAPKRL
jgi:hypothetical protein